MDIKDKKCPICGGNLSKVTKTGTKTWEAKKNLPTICENEWYKHKNNILFVLDPGGEKVDWEYVKTLNHTTYAEFPVIDSVHRKVTIPAK